MPEGHRFEPVDADVNVIAVVAPGKIQFLAARRAGADKNGIEFLLQQTFHAVDRTIQTQIYTHVDDVIDLFVKHTDRQTKRGYIRPHQAASTVELFKHDDLVTERQQIVGDR